jgi:hypothetical protein
MVNVPDSCGDEKPARLPTAQRLLIGLSNLVDANKEADEALAAGPFPSDATWRALHDSTSALQRRSQVALADFDPLVANAYRVERLAGIVAHACSTWSADEVTGSLTEGRVVTIAVDARDEPETSRLADRNPATYKVQVIPKALIRPSIAFAAVAAPGAKFPTYATQPVTGGVQIYESGRKDMRFSVGGTFALTWAGLDRRETRGMALWLPELAVTTGSEHAFGIGSALSWNMLKVGAGAMWIRHPVLLGAKAGDVVADASKMKLNDGYGGRQLYLSLSIFDWTPPSLGGGSGKK